MFLCFSRFAGVFRMFECFVFGTLFLRITIESVLALVVLAIPITLNILSLLL